MGFGDLYNGFVDLLKHTTAEIYLGAFLLAVGGGAAGMQYEYSRSEIIPLSFSEKTQIEKDTQREEKQLGAMTVYLTSTNDAAMKIFEAHNESRSPFGDEDRGFAKELEHAKDKEFKRHHYTLTDLLTVLPKQGAAALELMKEYTESMRNLSPVINRGF